MKSLKDKKIRLLYMKTTRPEGGITPVKHWLDCGIAFDDVEQWEDLPGGEKLATAPTVPLWAYFRSLSGKEIYTHGLELAGEEVLFTVNWQREIAPDMRVLFRGDMYDIIRVDTLEGYKGDVRLYCKRVRAG